MSLFKKAELEAKKWRVLLKGVSGAGKTTSALILAKTLAKGGKIALIDTEKLSSLHNAKRVDYDVLDFNEAYNNDHSVKNYIAAIEDAEKSGYEVLIIDSLTHSWSGYNGILDKVEALTETKYRGNSFRAWKDGTAMYNELINKILMGNNMHVICTVRVKTDYSVEDGKPRKIGLAIDQRNNLDYEWDLVLDFASSQKPGYAIPDKDRSSLFALSGELITENTGVKLLDYFAGAHSHINRAVEPEKAPEKDEVKVDTPKKETKKTEKAQVADEVLPKDEEVYFDDFTYIKDAEEKFKLTTDKANQKKYFEIMKGQGLTMDQIKAIVKGEDIQKAGVTAEQLREIRAGIILDFEAALDNSSVVESIMLD